MPFDRMGLLAVKRPYFVERVPCNGFWIARAGYDPRQSLARNPQLALQTHNALLGPVHSSISYYYFHVLRSGFVSDSGLRHISSHDICLAGAGFSMNISGL